MYPKKKELSLEEIQKNSFLVLKKIKEIFDKQGWRYYLAYGTLLGAIRHKGFIPWDDDIDIFVPRPDYEKFIKYCKDHKEELKPFELIHYSTNKKYVYPIARFSDSRYKIDYHNINDYGLGLFVDIYPLDGVSKKDQFIHKKIYYYNHLVAIFTLKDPLSEGSKWKAPFKKIFIKILKASHFNPSLALEKCDKISQKYPYDTAEYIDCVCWGYKHQDYKKSHFEKEKCKKPFNGESFSIPCGYDEILKQNYGDYMQLPPESDRVAHHFYSAYRKNLKGGQ